MLLALAAGCRPAPPPPLRVSFVGDVLLGRAVPAALARDSAALRRTARQLWADSCYVVGNLECPLTDTARPVRKAFVFQATTSWTEWLRSLGFTHEPARGAPDARPAPGAHAPQFRHRAHSGGATVLPLRPERV